MVSSDLRRAEDAAQPNLGPHGLGMAAWIQPNSTFLPETLPNQLNPADPAGPILLLVTSHNWYVHLLVLEVGYLRMPYQKKWQQDAGIPVCCLWHLISHCEIQENEIPAAGRLLLIKTIGGPRGQSSSEAAAKVSQASGVLPSNPSTSCAERAPK